MNTSYVYTGSLQTVNSGAVLNHSEATLVYSNNTFTEVGTGSYVVTITADETANYKAATATVTITVEKATVAVPHPETTVFIYNGSPITLLEVDADAPYTANGAVAEGIGMHTVTLTLKDTANYTWADAGFDGTLTFEITIEP